MESISDNDILDVNETWTYTASYTVTQEDIDNDVDLVNTVYVQTRELPEPLSDIAVTPMEGIASMEIEKSRLSTDSIVMAGQEIQYEIILVNTGTRTLTLVEVLELYPGDGTGILDDPLESISDNDELNVGETWILRAVYTVTQEDMDIGGQLINTARVRSREIPTPVEDTAMATVHQFPEITIRKETDAEYFTYPDEVIYYSLIVTNIGNVTLYNVDISDSIATVRCDPIPSLAPGDSAVCIAEYIVTLDDIFATSISNTAYTRGRDPRSRELADTSNTVVLPLNNLPPEITCPDPIIDYTTDSTCDVILNSGLSSVYSDINQNITTLTWVMEGATVDASPETGINNLESHLFNLGETTITYVVTDALGLSASCSFTVNILDSVSPVAICRDLDLYLDLYTGEATITEDDVNNGSYDNCGIASISIDNDHFDCTHIGENVVILTVTDFSGNTSVCRSIVTVHYAVEPDPQSLPDLSLLCNDGTTNIELINTIPVTTWTWTASSDAEISGAQDDLSGQLSTIAQLLHNSDSVYHEAIYTITPELYGLCQLDTITARVYINPTPEIRVSPLDTMICNDGTASLDIRNPNISVIGQWLYDLRVDADPAISGAFEGGTDLTLESLVQTLTNTDTVVRSVVYHFTPKILLNGGDAYCENGIEQTVTIWVRPSLEHMYSPVVSDYNGYNISCYESSDGYIALRTLEGVDPIYFDWTGPDGFTSSENVISELGPGTYNLTVTDDYGCIFTNEYVFIQPDELGADFTLSTSMDGGYNIDCAGGRTGTIDVEPFNYVDSVSFFWNDASIDQNRTDLAAGVYNVIIVDKNNCWLRTDLTLTEPDSIRLFYHVKEPYCPDSPDGEITVDALGGVPGREFTYLWSNSETTRTITELIAGPYDVSITDMNNCSVDTTIELVPLNNHCLVIPNAISPNGDMINDVWNLGFTEIYPEMTVLIFNQWGQLIWESEPGYLSPWDGTSNGVLQPVDSYFYVITLYDGETEPITGHVSVIY